MSAATKLIVFDLDGTLNRTELFAVEVHRMLQTEFGWPAQSPEKITALFGAPAEEYMESLLPRLRRADQTTVSEAGSRGRIRLYALGSSL